MSELGRRVVRQAVRSFSGGGSVLCFHSVAAPSETSAGSAHVPLARLAAAISVARMAGEIVPLRDLLARHQRGAGTAGLTAITFDDAYAALMGEAADFLVAEAVPATLFVNGDAAREGCAFWWDRVDHVAHRVSAERWRRFEEDCGVPDEYRRGQPLEYGPARALRQWILARYHGRWPEALGESLVGLEADAGSHTGQRPMTFEEIRALATRVTLDIGVHTLTHPVLPFLSDVEAITEIRDCHRQLQEQLDSVQPILAVPYGLFDHRTAALAKAAGMEASLTLEGVTLRSATRTDLVPRFCIMAGERSWKLALRLLGVADRLQAWRGREPGGQYPVLPSAST